MSLLSYTFLLFLLASLFAYYLVPKKFQWIILLAANTVFYAFSGIGNFVFIVLSSFVTYFTARIVSELNSNLKLKKNELDKADFKIEKQKVQNKKRVFLCIMLFINVGILVHLKYVNFLGHFQNVMPEAAFYLGNLLLIGLLHGVHPFWIK